MRAVNLSRLKRGGIGTRTETCVNWGGSLALVQCLHQGNIYIKRQSGVRRDQKCISLVGAKTPLTCAGRQTTPSQGRRYRAENGNWRKLGRIYGFGTVFAPRQYLYQKGARGMERPDNHSPIRCKTPCSLCRQSNYPVSREAVEGIERKLAKLGRIYRLGVLFTPRQHLYQKTARGMERPQMYSFSLC